MAAAAVLVAARWLDRPGAQAAAPHRFLDARGASIMAALIPVVLAGALPAAPEARERAVGETVDAFDRAVSGLSPAVREEVEELFGVLRFAPLRIAFTGLWSPVEASTPAEIDAFLARWRASRFDIQRAGYQALTQLIQAAWYGNPASWPGIGYPGAPRLPGR